jgi:hypothetical protein
MKCDLDTIYFNPVDSTDENVVDSNSEVVAKLVPVNVVP